MSIIGFINRIFPDAIKSKDFENDERFEISYKSKTFEPQNIELIEESFNFLSNDDSLLLTVIFGNSEPVILNSQNVDFNKFIEELEGEFEFQDEEEIKIIILINKNNDQGVINIYDFAAFKRELIKLNFEQFLNVFDRAFKNNENIIFRVHNLELEFYSSTIFFVPFREIKHEKLIKKNDRFLHIKKLNTVSNFDSSDKYELSPIDFELSKENSKHIDICEIFKLYALVLSVIYLFDISSVSGNILEYKLNGYKSFKGKIDISKLKNSKLNSYLPIFKWVFKGGSLTDKIGLSRNIISLHFEDKDQIYLTGNPYLSVQSSFKLYEKDNIKQYIELRNKISEQLIDFNNRASKIVENFANGFQKSSLALLSFYISTIVIRVLSKGDFFNVFTLDAMILSIAFLTGSLIYYFVSRWEIKSQRTRFVKSYQNLKNRYQDLLNEDDINRILNNDSDYQDDLDFIDNKRKNYSRMWLIILSILFITSVILHFIYNTHNFSNTELYQIIYKIFR
ncbi:hypothetical protein [Psychroflexus tropicus]|uniref:hypothetical protein n=1 Tax=Psychroflexus tropicus TaxID=197345 RepID=UPI0003686B07|nr:hypothetical protein [Psychroflexus tropicus]